MKKLITTLILMLGLSFVSFGQKNLYNTKYDNSNASSKVTFIYDKKYQANILEVTRKKFKSKNNFVSVAPAFVYKEKVYWIGVVRTKKTLTPYALSSDKNLEIVNILEKGIENMPKKLSAYVVSNF